jgi:hypothetical protein
MEAKGHRRITALVTTAVLALGPAAALADPPGQTFGHNDGQVPSGKDYSLNSVTGDYSPEKFGATPVTPVQASPAQTDNGFEWADAAAGAGVALLISIGAAGTTIALRRHSHGQPA